MIGSTKQCFRKMTGHSKVTLDQLSTAVAEVEMILNLRPITYLSSDDLDEPLTPSHPLKGAASVTYLITFVMNRMILITVLRFASVLESLDQSIFDCSQRRTQLCETEEKQVETHPGDIVLFTAKVEQVLLEETKWHENKGLFPPYKGMDLAPAMPPVTLRLATPTDRK
uniref:Uncharacterized protein n=1 Tax=Amphimedon queenslandica TaxID=400682 RepID=A0A1X7TZT4_AMPQE